MKRLLYISTLSMVFTLVLASVALAQGVEPGNGTGPYGCPEDMPFVASAPSDPGEASLLCFATEAEAEAYGRGETATPPATEEPPVTEGQYETPEAPTAPETPQTPEMSTQPSLPSTGGPALLMPAAGLLLATGLLGLAIVRRRS